MILNVFVIRMTQQCFANIQEREIVEMFVSFIVLHYDPIDVSDFPRICRK